MIKKRVEAEWIRIAIGLDSTSNTAIFLDAVLKVLDFETVCIENEMIRFVFNTIQDDVQKEAERQKTANEKRRMAGSKGGNAKWAKERQAQTNYRQVNAPQLPPKENEIFEAEVMEEFPWKEFIAIFPCKTNKKKAEELWHKLSNAKRKLAFEGVKRYVKEIEYRKQFDRDTKIMSPYTFLKDERWTDEYETHTTPINTNNQSASSYGSNNRQSYKEAEFERNARTVIENLQAAERGELAYLSPFNPPSGQR